MTGFEPKSSGLAIWSHCLQRRKEVDRQLGDLNANKVEKMLHQLASENGESIKSNTH